MILTLASVGLCMDVMVSVFHSSASDTTFLLLKVSKRSNDFDAGFRWFVYMDVMDSVFHSSADQTVLRV